MKLFSIFDSKAGAYTNPMVFRSAPEAIRAFGSATSDVNHDFNKYCEDYTLFELGEWDETLAIISMHPTPRPLCKAIEVSRAHSEFYFSSRTKAEAA